MNRLLDTDAVEFFAPKEFRPLVEAFDRVLGRYAVGDANLANYLANPFALFDDAKRFPIVHFVAMRRDGAWAVHRSPERPYLRREGHRTVNEQGADGTNGMQPCLRLEIVTDPKLSAATEPELIARARASGLGIEHPDLQAIFQSNRSAETPALVFSAPLAMLLRPHAARFLSQRFTLYQHIFGGVHEYPDDGPFYIGITARDWKTRWTEHLRAIKRGSNLAFHRQYRARQASKKLTFVHHKVMGVAASLERLQELEEALVGGHWEDARLLNMIPGGRAGLTYLRERGWLRDQKSAVPETAERALGQWLAASHREGMPSPRIAELWKTDDYALRVICGPEGRLSVEQVVRIRNMALEGATVSEILQATGALSGDQVRRVILGKTYSRVLTRPPKDG